MLVGALGSSLMAFQLAAHLCRAIVVAGCYMPWSQRLHQGSPRRWHQPSQLPEAADSFNKLLFEL